MKLDTTNIEEFFYREISDFIQKIIMYNWNKLPDIVLGIYYQFEPSVVTKDRGLYASLKLLCFLNYILDILIYTPLMVTTATVITIKFLIKIYKKEYIEEHLNTLLKVIVSIDTIMLVLAGLFISLWFPGAYITFGAFQPLPPPEPGKQWYPNPSFC